MEVERRAIAQCAMMHIDNAQNVSKFVVHEMCYAGRLSMILEDNLNISAISISNNSRLKVYIGLKWLDSNIKFDVKKCRKFIEQNIGFLEFAFDILLSKSARGTKIKIARKQNQTGDKFYGQNKSNFSDRISKAIRQGQDVFICTQNSISIIDQIISAIGKSYVLMLPLECQNISSGRQFNTFAYKNSFIDEGPVESIKRYRMLPDVIISDCFDDKLLAWSSIGTSIVVIGDSMPPEIGMAKDAIAIDLLTNRIYEKKAYEKQT